MGIKKSKQLREINSKYIENKNRYYFEDLSNDLIYELFDYLSFYYISLSFGNLNNRFQILIDSYSHYLNLQQYTSNQSLPRYIHTLKISAKYQLSFINLSNIISLRGLIVSNLTISYLNDIVNSLLLKDLEYVYLGACVDCYEYELQQLGEIQEKILSLGEIKLKKCVFRMKLFTNIDRLPLELPSLEYLRIDGCENRFIIDNLLNRMINLKFLHVSILEPIKSNDNHYQYIKQNNIHHCLNNLIIRIHDMITLDELIPLFKQYGLNLKHITIHLDSIRENSIDHKVPDKRFLNLQSRITTIINQFLPCLTNFYLRQQVISQNFDFLRRPNYFLPYVEEIPTTFEHKSYQISIASHLKVLWLQNS